MTSGCNHHCSGCSLAGTLEGWEKTDWNEIPQKAAESAFEITDLGFFKELKTAENKIREIKKRFPKATLHAGLLRQDMKKLSLESIRKLKSAGLASFLLQDIPLTNKKIPSPKCKSHLIYPPDFFQKDEFFLLNLMNLKGKRGDLFDFLYPDLGLKERKCLDETFYRKELCFYKREDFLRILKNLNQEQKPVFLYGANFIAEFISKMKYKYRKIRFMGVLDSSLEKQGRQLGNWKVLAPQILKKDKNSMILICSLSNPLAIREFLTKQMKISDQRILDFSQRNDDGKTFNRGEI